MPYHALVYLAEDDYTGKSCLGIVGDSRLEKEDAWIISVDHPYTEYPELPTHTPFTIRLRWHIFESFIDQHL